jgi:hypothetical protein
MLFILPFPPSLLIVLIFSPRVPFFCTSMVFFLIIFRFPYPFFFFLLASCLIFLLSILCIYCKPAAINIPITWLNFGEHALCLYWKHNWV